MSESHQYAAGEILLILLFTVLDLSNADFLSLLTSPVIVMHYLSRVIFLTAHRLGSNWLENTLSKELLLQANSYPQLREGVVRTAMQLISRVESQRDHFCVMTAFGWGAGTEAIGMTLIEQAGCLSRFRNGEFQTKVRDLEIRLSQSSSASIRAKLCSIYSANPVIFLSSDSYFKRVSKALAEDSEIDVLVVIIFLLVATNR
jgi:hypothetical protein